MKHICILGSTGSIGTQALDIIRSHPSRFKVTALSARNNIELLCKQVEEFHPEVVSVDNEGLAQKLKSCIPASIKTEVLFGVEGLKDITKLKNTDIVLVAVVGISGLLPTIEAIKAGKTIALANKETLVTGGSLVMPLAKQHNVKIIPVDSEHSAIFQCISNNSFKAIRKIMLTASGGPFRTWDKEQIKQATTNQALTHPNWNMGPKVTIDSATLMNKILEIIEARWLFDKSLEDIEIIIHPQSIIHSMVEFIDGSVIAQMSNPTMHLPIQYALSFPERINNDLVSPLDLIGLGSLEFYKPDKEKFPCLNFALNHSQLSGTYPVVLNAANEIAVNAYIEGKIKFYEIYSIIKECMNLHTPIENPTLEDILSIDDWTRKIIFQQSMILTPG